MACLGVGLWELGVKEILARATLRNRLAADGQRALNRPPRTNDTALRVFLDRLVLGALTAQTLKHCEVTLVAIVRQHLVALRRRVRNRDRVRLRVRLWIGDRRLVAEQIWLDARDALDNLQLSARQDVVARYCGLAVEVRRLDHERVAFPVSA